MLKKLDDTPSLAEATNLVSTALAGRFYLACRGVLDYLMPLVRGTVFEALQRGTERIDQDDLARVYEGKLAQQRLLAEQRNPFVGELDTAALDQVQPLDDGRVADIGVPAQVQLPIGLLDLFPEALAFLVEVPAFLLFQKPDLGRQHADLSR